MGETLAFPGLGLEYTLNRVAFTIGPVTIYWYGIIIALAFLAGISYALYRVKSFGLDGDRVIDVVIGGAIGGIIGARIYYVAFSWDQFKDDPIRIFMTWQGGIAIYGGIIGAFLAGLLMCKIRGVKFLPMLDLAVGGMILGQAIGRWGNFVNIEAFGGNTTLPWGMTSPAITNYLSEHMKGLNALHMEIDPTLPVHPTFLYESIWCLLGFIAIALYTNRRRFDGELLLIYTAWYGLGRSVIEGLRTDSLLLGTIRISQLVAVLCVLGALVAWVTVRSKIHRSADPDYLRLYVETEEGQSILAGTFYPKKGEKKAVAQEESAETASTSEHAESAGETAVPAGEAEELAGPAEEKESGEESQTQEAAGEPSEASEEEDKPL
ncbi:MAG: prolipoprotein diacylglyceryl transferase [Provencibacterium sp.]|nr:prolipoprotein diacylglyceryl transferase [Provencibacterium sp.]